MPAGGGMAAWAAWISSPAIHQQDHKARPRAGLCVFWRPGGRLPTAPRQCLTRRSENADMNACSRATLSSRPCNGRCVPRLTAPRRQAEVRATAGRPRRCALRRPPAHAAA